MKTADIVYLERLGEAKKIDHFCSRERGRSVRPTEVAGSSRQPERGGNKP